MEIFRVLGFLKTNLKKKFNYFSVFGLFSFTEKCFSPRIIMSINLPKQFDYNLA